MAVVSTPVPHVSKETRKQMLAHWRYRCEQAKARGEPLPPPPPHADTSDQSA